MIVSHKEISLLFDCSEKTSLKYLSDIKAHYEIIHVTKWHVKDYFKLDWYAMEISWQIRICKNDKRAIELVKIRESLMKFIPFSEIISDFRPEHLII